MSQLQQEAKPQTAMRRSSPARVTTPRPSQSSRAAAVPTTKDESIESTATVTTFRSKKAITPVPHNQEPENTDLLRMWLDPRTIVFCGIIFADLVIDIIHFAKTGDVSTFTPLPAYAAAYAGVKDVTAIIAKVKDIIRPPTNS